MPLEIIAAGAVGVLLAVRCLVALIDVHYRAAVEVRHAANDAVAKIEARMRARAESGKEE